MNGSDFERKKSSFCDQAQEVSGQWRLQPQTLSRLFHFTWKTKGCEKYNIWKVFKGSRIMYTARTLPGVFCNVLCAVQNVYSAVQAVDQQLAAGHKL